MTSTESPTLADTTTIDQLDRLAGCATLLSRLCLAAPDAALLDRLAVSETWIDWPLARPANTEARRLVCTGAAAGAQPLGAEYQRLFIGPLALVAHPYESVHLSVDRLLFDSHTVAVRHCYAAAGFSAPRPGREPEDHVGLELDFVARIAARAVVAADQGDQAAAELDAARVQAFLCDHVQRWVPRWAQLLADDAQEDFYRGVALLTLDTLDQVS